MGKINKKITRRICKKYNDFKCELIEDDKVNGDMDDPNIGGDKCVHSDHEDNVANGVSLKTKLIKRKTNFYEKCAKQRLEKGLIILPKNVETKIYKLKKALRKKGVECEEIKQIIRKKRRDEELKLRKNLKQLCFNCRQPGHSLSNCPSSNASEQSCDICYFCGSSEHMLSECVKYRSSGKNKNLPYAKCFICKKTGHLTRSCSDNTNGIFPKGGNCRLCGSVDHLIKDCKKNTEQMEDISLMTYNDNPYSVDVDDFQIENIKSNNKAKVIKF